MLSENSPVHRRLSLSACKVAYGYYGTFALYPLRTAVLDSCTYDPGTFSRVFSRSGENHCLNPTLTEYLSTLEYEDKEYFTVDETRFLMNLSAPCLRLSDNRVEVDMRTFRQQVKQGTTMLRSHAAILLKSAVYWKLRYREKYIAADEAYSARCGEEGGYHDSDSIEDV